MGKRFLVFVFLLLSLLLSSMLSTTEARTLRDLKLNHFSKASNYLRIHEAMIKGFFVHDVKVSGPSPGVGHRYNNVRTVEVEKAGPSPGEGHK